MRCWEPREYGIGFHPRVHNQMNTTVEGAYSSQRSMMARRATLVRHHFRPRGCTCAELGSAASAQRGLAGDRHCESSADFAHPNVGEPAEPVDEHGD